MNRPPAHAALALVVLAACTPQTQHGSGTGPGDANFILDGGCVIVGFNCNQTGDCSTPCGNDQSCVDACQAAACASGNSAFQAVRSCTIQNCWNRCLGGDTPDCEACSHQKCVSEQTACDNSACPVACATADGGLPDAAVPVRDAGSAQRNCSGVYACMGMCLVETPFLCIGVCRRNACPSANAALDAMMQCADTQCRSATDNRCKDRYSTHDCQACMEQRCAVTWGACSANGC